MKTQLRLALAGLLALLTLALLPAGGLQAQNDARCFPETGYCISGPIRRYWEGNGGLPVFGYPITPLQTETIESWSGPVQWFERDRLEDHSNESKGVLAGRLGAELLARQNRAWQFRPLGQAPQAGCRGFPETGYFVCGGFLTYWERNGGLARFGYPITDQIVERIGTSDYTVQYFERRRMEFHPENRPPFDVLLGLLGREVRENTNPAPQPAPVTPTPQPVSQQIVINEPAENDLVSSPMRVRGTITRVPASRDLLYRIIEPNGVELARGNIGVSGQVGQNGSFNPYLAYRSPQGNRIVLELSEIDPTSGAVVARTVRNLRYAPTDAQRITIDRPTNNSRVGTRISLAGRTALYPSEGDLTVEVLDSRGVLLTSFLLTVVGQPGETATFASDFTIADQGGRLITIAVLDANARGDVIARSETKVYAGNSAYPAP